MRGCLDIFYLFFMCPYSCKSWQKRRKWSLCVPIIYLQVWGSFNLDSTADLWSVLVCFMTLQVGYIILNTCAVTVYKCFVTLTWLLWTHVVVDWPFVQHTPTMWNDWYAIMSRNISKIWKVFPTFSQYLNEYLYRHHVGIVLFLMHKQLFLYGAY